MFKKDGISSKRKILNTQLEYERIVKITNKHSDCYIFLSIQYYTWWKVIGHLIALGAILKRRKSRASHTASIYKFGHDPRIVESTGHYKGVNHRGLYDAFFLPGFHGKVVMHCVPCSFTKKDRLDRSDRIEHIDLGIRYPPLKAIRAFYDMGKAQTDDKESAFCTDYINDDFEKAVKYLLEITGNNAEATPAEQEDTLNKYTKTLNIKRYVIRDTRC